MFENWIELSTNQNEATQSSGFFVVSCRYERLVVTEWYRERRLADGLTNDSTANNKIVFVDDKRLSRSDSPNGSEECYVAMSC